jgi:hypothetical protein
MKTYPTTPYYDDYDETKNFYRILFKPGRAVQARELTQMQTLIQGQIERFGKNIFKEGSIVVPGEQVYDTRYKYVKLVTSYNSVVADDVIDSLVDKIVIGQTTGVRALVVNYVLATSTDEPTIYVKYLNSGTDGTTTAFSSSEVITTEDSATSIQAIATSPTGTGTAFSTTSGALFVKGSFVYYPEQTLIVEKYSVPSNVIIGFQITESVITSDDDETLLDPAIETYNYFAPGADRYKISLALSKRSFTPAETDEANFVEIVRVQDSEIIRQTVSSNYNILNDTLARRTYDESGDYTVTPYRVQLKEHLRTTNANTQITVIDGMYTAGEGGNSSLFLNVVSPGKAYVKGYEIDSIRTKYVEQEKARDSVSVTNSTIATTFGNYILATNINSIPDLANLATLSLYNQYTSVVASPAGTKIGTAKIRSIEFDSGTIGTATAVYKLYLFDIIMESGYSFTHDVKQLYYDNASYEDFTADIVPTNTALIGTVTASTLSNTIVGVGTTFTTQLATGDYITIGTQSLRIMDVASSYSANVTPRPSSNLAGVTYSYQTATIQDSALNSYIFPLPYNVIKSVDAAGTATTYTSRRVYSRTLSGGNVSITAGTDEVFSGFSTDNYQLVVTSGGNAGSFINLTSSNVTRSGSPTGKTLTITLHPTYTSEDVIIVTTLQKSNSAADKKVKTLVSAATIDYTTENTCTAATITLGKADIYQLSSVKMSANAFGTAYSTTNEVDITSRFIFDNGQRNTYYDVGTIKIKPEAAKPTGPIRITFDYFTHGAGDYFSVESYNDIDYEDIPSFVSGGVTYNLRDCLDFRSRINDAGTAFTGTGASVTEFLDFENDVITDYEYYLPRIDKLVLDRSGRIRVVKGVSSLNPAEPPTPSDAMVLYIHKQAAYVFDITKDITIFPVDNKRFTMRDIGRIENRVKNLEYYTTLSLAEKDTQIFQIKDAQGFDRFKNGFIVDSFTGHGIGDPTNIDYSVAIDYNKNEARPLCETRFVKLGEQATTLADRTANNYVLAGDLYTLPYTEEAFITNTKSSKTVNLNPFNVVLFSGQVTLDPPSDVWFNDKRVPDVYRDVQGNYDSLLADAKAKGTYGTVWGNWRDLRYGNSGNELVQQQEGITYTITETINTTVNNDIVVSKTVIPKMRDVVIKFNAEGMKPNTRLYAYFNSIDVTPYLNRTANAISINEPDFYDNAYSTYEFIASPILTDASGNASGYYSYIADINNLNTGKYTFRLTDSASNTVADQETFSETIFNSSGELRNIANEIVSTRNARLDSTIVTQERTQVIATSGGGGGGGGGGSTDTNDTPVVPVVKNVVGGYITQVYVNAFGRQPDAAGLAYWEGKFADRGVTATTLSNMTVNATSPSGALSGSVSLNAAGQAVYGATIALVAGGVSKNETAPNGLLGQLTTPAPYGPGITTVQKPILSNLDAVKAISATLVNGVANGASVSAITARAILK